MNRQIGELVGYINPAIVFPSPVIAILRINTDYHALYPNNELIIMNVQESIEEWAASNHAILCDEEINIKVLEDEFVYAIYEDDLLIGTEDVIRQMIMMRLSFWRGSPEHGFALAEFSGVRSLSERFAKLIRGEFMGQPQVLELLDGILNEARTDVIKHGKVGRPLRQDWEVNEYWQIDDQLDEADALRLLGEELRTQKRSVKGRELVGRERELVGRVREVAAEVLTLQVPVTQEAVGTFADHVHSQVPQARAGFLQQLLENPLALGVLAFGLGAALGFLIPEARREDELLNASSKLLRYGTSSSQPVHAAVSSGKHLGEARDNLLRQAPSAVREVVRDTMQETPHEVERVQQKS